MAWFYYWLKEVHLTNDQKAPYRQNFFSVGIAQVVMLIILLWVKKTFGREGREKRRISVKTRLKLLYSYLNLYFTYLNGSFQCTSLTAVVLHLQPIIFSVNVSSYWYYQYTIGSNELTTRLRLHFLVYENVLRRSAAIDSRRKCTFTKKQ